MKEKQGEARNIDKKNSETQKKEKEERRTLRAQAESEARFLLLVRSDLPPDIYVELVDQLGVK